MDRCPRCNAPDPGQRCKTCKVNKRLAKAGLTGLGACTACETITRVYSNGECRQCLATKELRECLKCHEVKPTHLCFNDHKTTCRDCLHPLRGLDASQRARARDLRKKYGLTWEIYQEMIRLQGGACKICHRVVKVLVVDHDHGTGRIRGLLCHRCNIGIGNLRDSTAVIASALAYLTDEPEPLPQIEPLVLVRTREEDVEMGALREAIATAYHEIEDLKLQLTIERRRQPNPSVFRALVTALRREIVEKKNISGNTREKSLAWLDNLTQ